MNEIKIVKNEVPRKRKRSKRTMGVHDLIVANKPKSSVAEAIKSIKTNILFSSVDKDLRMILVTSPESGDGKSLSY